MTRPANRRALAEKAVATRGVSIELACRASEVCSTLAMAGLLFAVVRKTTIET